MNQPRWMFLLTLIVVAGIGPGSALGQLPYTAPRTSPLPRPAFSPYLNLLNRNTNPAIQYYGIVRPEEEFTTSIQQLQVQGTSLQQSVGNLEANAAIPPTGHRSQFMNYNKYFQNLNGPNPMTPGANTGIGTRPPVQSGRKR
jgi:hypothetical protein